jgi:predicted ATPase
MIRRIEALNYRGLRYVSQELGPLQILVGPNASGKSTFLDVVALLSDFVRNGLEDAILFRYGSDKGRASRLHELIFNQGADHFELAVELSIPEHLRGDESGSTPRYDIARYEVMIGQTSKGELGIASERLYLVSNDTILARAKTEASRRTPTTSELETPQTLSLNIDPDSRDRLVVSSSRMEGGPAYYHAERSSWEQFISPGSGKSALANVPADPDRFPIAIWVSDVLRYDIRTFALDSAAMRRPVSPLAARSFSAEGVNLPFVMRNLQENHPQAYKDWLAHIRTILPDVADIRVIERPEDRHLYLKITYSTSKEPVPSWLVSDGTLRLFALTLIPYVPEQASGVFLIEEPENGVHPKALEGIYESLSSVYRGQVLIATHAPLLMGLAELDQLLCFTKSDFGAVDIVRGDEHPILMNWRGEVALSTLYAGGALG